MFFFFAWCKYLAKQGRGQGPCTLALGASQTFAYRGLTDRVIIVILNLRRRVLLFLTLLPTHIGF